MGANEESSGADLVTQRRLHDYLGGGGGDSGGDSDKSASWEPGAISVTAGFGLSLGRGVAMKWRGTVAGSGVRAEGTSYVDRKKSGRSIDRRSTRDDL